MAEIVGPQGFEACFPHGRRPEPAAPAREPHGTGLRCPEDEVVRPGRVGPEMLFEGRDDDLWERNRPPARPRLWRTKMEMAAHLDARLSDVHSAAKQIDPMGANAEHLADP